MFTKKNYPITYKIIIGCLAILYLFMFLTIGKVFFENIIIERLKLNLPIVKIFDCKLPEPLPSSKPLPTAKIEWAKLYPFSEETSVKKSYVSLYEDFINTIEKKISANCTDNLPYQKRIVPLAYMYENLLFWNITPINGYNGVVKLSDDYLFTVQDKRDVSENVQSVIAFSQFLKNNHIEFLYVQSPAKLSKYTDQNYDGVIDFTNQNMDKFLVSLAQSNIPYLDLRENIRDQRLNHHELFYKTDHHWKAETGLWASKEIADCLNKRFAFDCETEILSPENYRYDVYKNWFLGSQGKKLTLAKAKPEDITFIYPTFKNDIRFRVPDRQVDVRGDLSITYDEVEKNISDYYYGDRYGAYMYHDNPLVTFHNNLDSDGKKLLILKDSFVNSMAPFLALGIEDIEILDLRHFTGSVQRYIQQNPPDLVMVMYSGIGEIDYSSHKSLFDFR